MDRPYLKGVVLFALAIGIRLLYVGSTPPDAPVASVDAWGYHRLALNLDRGNGFSLRRQAPFVPDSIRTPLYPAFLWLVRRVLGPEPRTAAIVQALLDACTTGLVYWLGKQLSGPRAGRIAALLYALNPTQVRYVNELLTETLLSFLLVSCLCVLVCYVRQVRRTAWLLLAALLTGLAILCKPNVQYLPLVWLPAIALRHGRNWRHTLVDAGLLFATIACVLTPWVVRNSLTYGRPFLSTAFEGNISRVSAPAALATARAQYAIPWSDEWEALFGEIVTTAAHRYGWHKPWDTLTARELDTHNHQVYLVARELLLRHPTAWLVSHVQGMGRYLEPQTFRVCYARFAGRDWPPDIPDDIMIYVLRTIAGGDLAKAGEIVARERWHRLDVLQRVVWWGTFAGQVIGLLLALTGAWRLRRQPALVAVLLLTIAYVLWVPGPIAYDRFRVPVTGLILSLVGVSGSTIGEQEGPGFCIDPSVVL